MVTPETPKLSRSEYASRRKELLSLVKQLRAIGAQADLDLPRITVIGNQSAGKSSVVEAISGINVPRDAGTCTRCPMECRLSSSNKSWSCQVSIRWEFDDSGRRKGEVSEVPFGDLITDRTQVELALRRAQAAVLHPETPPHQFLSMSAEKLKTGPHGKAKTSLPFSRNAVCVDLEGPELTDLSFIDLPGIIQNAEPDVVKLVEDLVVSHIKGNCLILVALPMTDDIENQKALRLAHQEDPAGRRTIGVVTKPDMLGTGSTKARDLWLDVIEGRRYPLTHGYYCTRHPDDAERTKGILPTQARVAEADFFKETAPWSSSVHQHRLGTNNLVTTLSTLLVQIINDTLPNVREETTALLETCKSDLSALPKALEAEPATYMLSLITAFCNDISLFVQGNADTGRLIHENRAAYSDFKTAIRRTAPNFISAPGPGERKKSLESVPLDWAAEDEGVAEASIAEGQPFYLKDMRKYIEKSITRELPDNVPFQCKVALIAEFQSTWAKSAEMCFDRVRESTRKILFQCIEEQFQRFDSLQSHLKMFLSELLKHHQLSCQAHIDAILENERTPFTQNTHYLQTCKDKWLAMYKDARAGKTGLSLEPPLKKQRKDSSAPSMITACTTTAPVSQANSASASGKTSSGGFSFGSPSNPPTPIPFSFSSSTSSTTSQSSQQPTAKGMFGNLPQAPATSSVFASRPSTPASLSRPTITQSDQPSDSSVFAPPTPKALSATAAHSNTSEPEKVNAILAALAEIGYTGLKEEDLGKLNPPDVYETELNVMAEVRGYFQIAYKRIIDNVPSLIDLMFVKAVTKELQPFLIAKLALGTANASARCAMYLAEDPNIVARRDELVARKKRLEGVEVELYNFGL